MNAVISRTKSAMYQLTGLEADNLLAFLALLGLLRALDTARPEWEARVAWHGMPPQADLHLASDASREQVIAEVDKGICGLSCTYRFDKVDLRQYTIPEFRELAEAAVQDRERAVLISALASDVVEEKDSKKGVHPQATALCALGTGQTGTFLERLQESLRAGTPTAAGRTPDAKRPGGKRGRKSSKGKRRTPSEELRRALFERWRYDDDKDLKTFRWDPIEDRRYAYQFGDPTEGPNKIGTVRGANRLAAFGVAMLTSAPTASGLATLSVFGDRPQSVCWPLASIPTSLKGHVALLAHRWLGDEQRALQLAHYGVLAVARAQRYLHGYVNFARARVQYL